MTRLRNSLGRLTLRVVLGRRHLSVALLAVGLAGISLTLMGVLTLRAYANHNLHLIARSINYTVEASVVFNDSSAANEALALIAATEEVADAKVFDDNGDLLARWQRHDDGMLAPLKRHLASTLLEDPINLPVLHQGQQVGRIELVGQGDSLMRFLLSGLIGIMLCTVLSAFGALSLSRRLFGDIVGPLRNLANVAHAARCERRFDRRVPPAQIAELNELGNDFNALLDELETWQHHLQSENATLAHKASHDSLTGLPNRAFFEGRLSRTLRSASHSQELVAVLFIDSDHFKTINDTYGHAAGDEVLITVANRVRAQLREHDLVARLGGDEFAVLLAPIQRTEDAERIADKIIASMRTPIHLPDGQVVVSSLSVGLAVYPDDGDTPTELLSAADAAMYHAKHLGRGGRHNAESEHSAASTKNRS